MSIFSLLGVVLFGLIGTLLIRNAGTQLVIEMTIIILCLLTALLYLIEITMIFV